MPPEITDPERTPAARPVLVCLLPVRNGADDLADYLASVARFADAVVALDDGSTDDTADILRAHPLVHSVLTNPRREDYRGWDDSGNRTRLLEAAAPLDPEWIISLDADERIDPDDATALRTFIDRDALPGFAYGFRVFRMTEDMDHYDQSALWVYRMFAFEPEQRFPEERLHFVPIPTSIPRVNWLRTTIRIQHIGGQTEARRRARFDKYREADPEKAFQTDYSNLLAAPQYVSDWEPRPADLPVLASLADEEFDSSGFDFLSPDSPIISAIVIARDDEDTIERAVASVVRQEVDEPFEVIVVTSGNDRTADIVREKFPDVHLIALDRPALPGEARNAGVRIARGDFVSFPGSHVELPQGSLAARLRAHELGYPMVTGSTLNGTKTRAGWASYFLDHAGSLPGRPSEQLRGPPSHCSYDRELLLQVGGFPEDMRAGEDTVVNRELTIRGHPAYRASDITFVHHSPCRTVPRLLRHHFVRGRAMGRILLDSYRHRGKLVNKRLMRRLMPYVGQRVRGTSVMVERWGDDEARETYRRVRRLVVAGAVSAWTGMWYEIFRPARGKRRILVGKPGRTFVIAGLDRFRIPEGRPGGRADLILIVRLDLLDRSVRVVSIPRDLYVDVPGIGPGRINGSYHHGAVKDKEDPDAGAKVLRRTIERTFDIKVDHHVILRYEGFRQIVDALGGIDIDVPRAIDDDFLGVHFEAGRQHMDGKAALRYVRTRYADSDMYRRDRHLAAMSALIARARSIRSPIRVARVLRTARRFARTSVGLRTGAGLARVALRLRAGDIAGASLGPPIVKPGTTEDGRYVYRGNAERVATFVRESLGFEKRRPEWTYEDLPGREPTPETDVAPEPGRA